MEKKKKKKLEEAFKNETNSCPLGFGFFSELPVDAKTYHIVVLLHKTHLMLTE